MASNIDNCPKCKVSFIGEPIPEDMLEHYSGTHWRREIGIEIRGKYDGISEWRCPDCGYTWDRWTGEEVKNA